jgi:hypothetical protein
LLGNMNYKFIKKQSIGGGVYLWVWEITSKKTGREIAFIFAPSMISVFLGATYYIHTGQNVLMNSAIIVDVFFWLVYLSIRWVRVIIYESAEMLHAYKQLVEYIKKCRKSKIS